MDKQLKECLDTTEARAKRLLERDDQALTSALLLAGILAIHGRYSAVESLVPRAKTLGLDLDKIVLERLRECSWDLGATSGLFLGISVSEAQELYLTCQFLGKSLSMKCLAAAEGVRDRAEEVDLDFEAIEFIEGWQQELRIPAVHDWSFCQVIYPACPYEIFLAQYLFP